MAPVPIDELINYPGLISFTFEEAMAYLIMAVWTISRASDSVAGELNRGTLEMLLAQPISRRKYLATHSAVTVLGIVLLALSAYGGTYTGIHTTSVKTRQSSWQWRVPILGIDVGADQSTDPVTRIPMSQQVEPRIFRPATLNYACLGFFLAGITTALSALDRYRWRTIGIVVSFYVVQVVLELTGMALENYRWLLRLSFFSAYEPVAFTTAAVKDPDSAWRFFADPSQGVFPDLGPLACDAVLLGFGLLGFLIGAGHLLPSGPAGSTLSPLGVRKSGSKTSATTVLVACSATHVFATQTALPDKRSAREEPRSNEAVSIGRHRNGDDDLGRAVLKERRIHIHGNAVGPDHAHNTFGGRASFFRRGTGNDDASRRLVGRVVDGVSNHVHPRELQGCEDDHEQNGGRKSKFHGHCASPARRLRSVSDG